MKLLLDQNLSYRLLKAVYEFFPDSKHVAGIGMESACDQTIWRFALEHGYTIISKDSDFLQKALLYGHPPKIIYLRLGNCSTRKLINIVVANTTLIKDFICGSTESVLVLNGE